MVEVSKNVVLSAPSGYEWLVERVWPVVVERVPAGYDMIVKLEHPGAATPSPEAPGFRALRSLSVPPPQRRTW